MVRSSQLITQNSLEFFYLLRGVKLLWEDFLSKSDMVFYNVIKFSKLIPEGSILVSESGILSKEDLDNIVLNGVRNFLIGEYLMKSEDRVGLLQVLLNA